MPWNKLCVDLIGPYFIQIKEKQKYTNLKAVTMINPVTGWFKITQYDNKRSILAKNLVDTTLVTRYPWLTEITYDQGLKLLVVILEIPN